MEHLLKESDIFQGLEVTRTSDKFCFFGKTRLSWSKIAKLIESGEKVIFRLSPNKIIDWTNKDNVLEYFGCFKFWNTYITGMSNRFETYKGILEVKDGIVFHENEYYLSAPHSKWEDGGHWWNCKQENIKDGKYNVTLLKQENDWYPKEDVNLRKNITLNLFILGSEVKSSIKELKPNTTELWAAQWDYPITFDYEQNGWDGISFSLRSFDSLKFFRKYYIQHRWSSDSNIEITDDEIKRLLYPIENKIYDVLSNALNNRHIHINSIDYVSNMLQFEKPIAEKVFNIVTEHLNKINS